MGDTAVDLSLLAGLSLSRGTIDRAAQWREDADWLAARWSSESTRVLPLRGGLAPVIHSEGRPRLAFVSPSDIPAGTETILLGVADDGMAYFCARATHEESRGEGSWTGLREVGAQLDDDEVGLMATAVALDNWHAAHPRCARCGGPTHMANAGWVRRCADDGSEHYPRTDPAIIALVIDADGRALLGRQGRWEPTWFSTLAGFVEPGESAEAAVRREIHEESGIVIGEVAYLGSQPWPFPCSLMLGYHAWALTTDIQVDGEEIVEARWFSRTELADACASGEVALPPEVSIARRLIERWYGDPLPGDWIRP